MERQRFFLIACQLTALAAGCTGFEEKPLDPEREMVALEARKDPAWIVGHVKPGEGGSEAGRTFDLSDGFDEDEVVALALAANPAIQARRIEEGEAESLLITAGLWPNPEVGFAWRPGIGVPGYTIETDVLWDVLRPWERSARKDAAAAHIDEVHAGIIAAEWELAVRVRAQYLEILAAEQVLQLLREESLLYERVAAMVKAGRDAGERTDLDVSMAELELAEARRDERRSLSDLEGARRDLVRLLGLPPDYAPVLSASGKPLEIVVFEGVDDTELRSRLLHGRFELRAKEAAYRKTEEELRLAVYRQFPRLNIGPSYQKEIEGGPTLGIGLTVELPLLDRNQGEIAEKEKLRERTRAEYVALLHGLLSIAFDARERLLRARLEVDAQEREVLPMLRRTQELFEGAFRARESSLSDWVAARRRAVKTRLDHLQTLVRYRKSVIDFEAATGMRLSAPVSPAARRTPGESSRT